MSDPQECDALHLAFPRSSPTARHEAASVRLARGLLALATLAGAACGVDRNPARREAWDLTPAVLAASSLADAPLSAFATDEGPELPRASVDSATLPQRISFDDPRLRFVGRFVTKDGAKRCAWGGSAVEAMIEAPEFNLLLTDTASRQDAPNYVQIVFDDRERAVLRLAPGRTVYRVRMPVANGPHRVAIVKRTEASFGAIEVRGLQLPEGGRLLGAPAPRPHALAALGDSITAGFGISYSEAADADPQTHVRAPDWQARTENAYLTYAAMAARAMAADYMPFAFSGKGVHDNLDRADPVTYPLLFQLALPTENGSPSVTETPPPDAVLVNLGTNDSLGRMTRVPHDPFVTAYEELLRAVRARWPAVPIFCTIGPMLRNRIYVARLDHARAYIREAVAARRATGDAKVFYFELAPTDIERDGLGADWHPNFATHAKTARQVVRAMRPTLGW